MDTLKILWADADLVVVNKPAGLASLPDGYDLGAPHLKGVLEPEFGPLWIVHRLDRATSGVMVLARNASVHRALNLQFERRQVEKQYHGIIEGLPEWESRSVRLALKVDGDRKHRTRIDTRHGKPSQTDFLILERLAQGCLLQAILHTGRTHQIRAHLSALNLPLLGDTLYGAPPSPLLDRPALHAYRLALQHPTSGDTLDWCAPYPLDFEQALETLRRSY